MRVLVSGSRDRNDKDLVAAKLDEICDEFGLWSDPDEYGNRLPSNITVISGGARGIDSCAADWCAVNWVELDEYRADWDTLGYAAGSIRNQRMLDEGKPDLVLAFPGPKSRGTWDMVRRARDANVPVRIYR